MLMFSPLFSLDFGGADCGPNRYPLFQKERVTSSGISGGEDGVPRDCSPDLGRPSPRGYERGSLCSHYMALVPLGQRPYRGGRRADVNRS